MGCSAFTRHLLQDITFTQKWTMTHGKRPHFCQCQHLLLQLSPLPPQRPPPLHLPHKAPLMALPRVVATGTLCKPALSCLSPGCVRSFPKPGYGLISNQSTCTFLSGARRLNAISANDCFVQCSHRVLLKSTCAFLCFFLTSHFFMCFFVLFFLALKCFFS